MVGAGFTGVSAALELAAKGFSVILLESRSIAFGASGRNGGQLSRGFAKGVDWMVSKFGQADASFMCKVTMEGLGIMLNRITTHQIKCDLKFGHLTAALKPKHMGELKEEAAAWKKLGYGDLELLDARGVQDIVKAKPYIGGMLDPKAAHFHPINYALGVATAAQKAGCRIYDETPVVEVISGEKPKVITARGSVNCKFVILAGVTNVKGAEKLVKKSITATAHMIATEPLGVRRARNLMNRDVAVSDCRFIMDYYRFSSDYRLLFGGNCNYSDMSIPGEDERLRQRMINIFPALRMVRMDNCWRGPLEFTINRMPDIGRLSPQVYYAHGFGGQGVVATNIAGKILAEAVSGQAERFDVFAKVKHANFPGGDILKRPLFVLGMTWFKLRDLV
ncbi:MAG: NAD(P)/FAD-dependent oxidoreductase [Alphaproteobacteria bacterium]